MAIQLRQICLVAQELQPVLDDLTHILGIEECFVDPAVGKFGLENSLMPIGKNFLEVVAPTEEKTAAGRYIERRRGDGGYMVITQADSQATFAQVRQNALDNGVRIAHESQRGQWQNCQLHPRDMVSGFLEIECDEYNDFDGYWHPVGGDGWQGKVNQTVIHDFVGVHLQSDDPVSLAELWSRVTDIPVELDAGIPVLSLNNANLRFVEPEDDRGPGLSAIEVKVENRAALISEAKARNCFVGDNEVEICGVRWLLV